MSQPSTRELQDQLVADLKKWQKTEGAAVKAMDDLSRRTTSPVLLMLAEIIREDSKRHAKVQQLVIDSLQKAAAVLMPDDLAEVWSTIEEHIATERGMFTSVRTAVMAVRGKRMPVQQLLLEYLMYDEEKHHLLLEKLEGMKKGLYAGG